MVNQKSSWTSFLEIEPLLQHLEYVPTNMYDLCYLKAPKFATQRFVLIIPMYLHQPNACVSLFFYLKGKIFLYDFFSCCFLLGFFNFSLLIIQQLINWFILNKASAVCTFCFTRLQFHICIYIMHLLYFVTELWHD